MSDIMINARSKRTWQEKLFDFSSLSVIGFILFKDLYNDLRTKNRVGGGLR